MTKNKSVLLKVLVLINLLFMMPTLNAQDEKKSWQKITRNEDTSWFATPEAKQIADNVLLYQRDIGGWPKNIEMQKNISKDLAFELNQLKKDPNGCTIDNGATTQELIYLAKTYQQQPDPKYKTAFLKGVLYLTSAQYANGGWPQFFPLKNG